MFTFLLFVAAVRSGTTHRTASTPPPPVFGAINSYFTINSTRGKGDSRPTCSRRYFAGRQVAATKQNQPSCRTFAMQLAT